MGKKIKYKEPYWRCSGYGVFSDGKKCKGCSDCGNGKKVMTISGIEASISSRVVTISKGDTMEDIFDKIERKRTKLLKRKK